MKISELSKATGVHQETIRMYREKGFLCPVKEENGYYDYPEEDRIALMHLRKLRNNEFSLSDIRRFYEAENTDEILALCDRQTEEIQRRIELLSYRLRALSFEKQHLLEEQQAGKAGVMEITSVDEKLDVDEEDVPVIPDSLYPLVTTSFYIPKEVLNGPCTDRMIDIRPEIGTYRYVAEQFHLPVPAKHRISPHGKYLCQIVRLTNLSAINLLALSPMMTAARDRGTPFLSGTTAHLVSIERSGRARRFVFRVRACTGVLPRPEHPDALLLQK